MDREHAHTTVTVTHEDVRLTVTVDHSDAGDDAHHIADAINTLREAIRLANDTRKATR